MGQSVDIGTGVFTVEFSERMLPGSINAFSLSLNSSPVSGSFSYNTNLDRLTFSPSALLLPGSYSLVVSSGALDWSSHSNAFS